MTGTRTPYGFRRYRLTAATTFAAVVVLSCNTTERLCENLCPNVGEEWTSASRLSDKGLKALRNLVGVNLRIGDLEVRIARYAKVPAGMFRYYTGPGEEDLPKYEYAVLCKDLGPPEPPPIIAGGFMGYSFFQGRIPIPVIQDADVADLWRRSRGEQHESPAQNTSDEYRTVMARLSSIRK